MTVLKHLQTENYRLNAYAQSDQKKLKIKLVLSLLAATNNWVVSRIFSIFLEGFARHKLQNFEHEYSAWIICIYLAGHVEHFKQRAK